MTWHHNGVRQTAWTGLNILSLDQLLDLEGKMYDLRKIARDARERHLTGTLPTEDPELLRHLIQELDSRVAWYNTMIDRIEVALEIATKKAAQDAQLPIEQSTWHHNGVRQA
tara:strand:+ start:780 stop:1115 length:336 start_codon:yes stop_codon:yes gene_type:complete